MEADEMGTDLLSMNFFWHCSIYSTDIQFQGFVASATAFLKISKETGEERQLVSGFELKQFATILDETFAIKKEQITNQIEIDQLNNLPEHMMIKKELSGRLLKEAVDDQTLSLYWKGQKPIKSIRDVEKYFKPLALSFTSGRTKTLYELIPEAYLIISGNVCLGIMNGTEVGLKN